MAKDRNYGERVKQSDSVFSENENGNFIDGVESIDDNIVIDTPIANNSFNDANDNEDQTASVTESSSDEDGILSEYTVVSMNTATHRKRRVVVMATSVLHAKDQIAKERFNVVLSVKSGVCEE